ncbi:alpha-2-glucosyltransferase Alg10 [Piptocephalis cylindrospora]|uniref:Dol-P-Glc:Glc(2)Man(9)GlcNAc(2)-PP-Dol alpha-1,2-glucosyltransferase n=1 Tax=Piptocephalis cylindrospora TaxID=1907219 RepID=A0A4P9Y3K7_9FUNG|nr:alpha-2-glucosyltransferase Alg10 [Piptocephalis cylindrospora]|eukprot:RKP13507.1 alpha-2-glucosyltransferase Alg10 [Piptocephalis cylindrospora]
MPSYPLHHGIPLVFLGLSLAWYEYRLAHTVPEPYMDEPFHVPQARLLCETGSLLPYDPKLTTPPGLYLVSTALLLPLRLLFQAWTDVSWTCGTTALRVTNAILGLLLYLALVRHMGVHSAVDSSPARTGTGGRPSSPLGGRVWVALAITSFPTLYFFHGLYYTDTGSALCVLTAYTLAHQGKTISSAILAAFAILFRQTNVVWILLIALEALYTSLPTSSHPHLVKEAHLDQTANRTSPSQMLHGTGILIRTILFNPSSIFPLLPYAAVIGAFGAFLIWNQGIVLGDKMNHVAGIHLPQLLYFSVFLTLATAPASLRPSSLTRHTRWILQAPLQYLLACLAVLAAIHHSTLAHPFLLSDNRHSTFYLWRWFLSRPVIRYSLTPLYVFCIWHCTRSLAARANYLWCLGYLTCTAIILIPSPLIELRYFTIPYVLARVQLGFKRPGLLALLVELALWFTVNLGTIHLFLERPFTWPGHEEAQRFMW